MNIENERYLKRLNDIIFAASGLQASVAEITMQLQVLRGDAVAPADPVDPTPVAIQCVCSDMHTDGHAVHDCEHCND